MFVVNFVKCCLGEREARDRVAFDANALGIAELIRGLETDGNLAIVEEEAKQLDYIGPITLEIMLSPCGYTTSDSNIERFVERPDPEHPLLACPMTRLAILQPPSPSLSKQVAIIQFLESMTPERITELRVAQDLHRQRRQRRQQATQLQELSQAQVRYESHHKHQMDKRSIALSFGVILGLVPSPVLLGALSASVVLASPPGFIAAVTFLSVAILTAEAYLFYKKCLKSEFSEENYTVPESQKSVACTLLKNTMAFAVPLAVILPVSMLIWPLSLPLLIGTFIVALALACVGVAVAYRHSIQEGKQVQVVLREPEVPLQGGEPALGR